MAYMPQTRKKQMAPRIKAVLKKYGCKGTLSVRNHSTLVCKIKSGRQDVIGNYNEVASGTLHRDTLPSDRNYHTVNPYWVDQNYSGEVREFLTELVAAMNCGNHDNSDIMTDYFDVGWYIDIEFGSWEKDYELTA